ncbi:MAG: acyl-CoA dehydrogenase [Chloroflexi bacterium]|nr:acyl-CoA dehydrogenase [Chloroflexota bacterium]
MTVSGIGVDRISQGGPPTGWTAVAQKLGPGFASRAAGYDANDSFVAENYVELKEQKVLAAGVPAELGGGGATHAELCDLLREVGRYCGSTALALSMHTHPVATLTWMWRQGRPVAPMLERIAANQLVLVTTGASDWLDSSGKAERVAGGYRVSGRKRFGSGSPIGDLLLTSAPYDDPNEGPTVLHFAVPMHAEGLTVLDNWRTMGMRATGSNDILLDGVFVPDAAVDLRRPKGVWHPFFNVIPTVALPLVLSVYLGVAEAARELALRQVAAKRDDPEVWPLVGEMENALATGQMAVREMVELCANYTFAPEVATANAVFVRKTIAAEALKLTVEKALETVGGGGFFRGMGLERLLRDIHAAQFHPLPAKPQHRFTGRVALGLDPVT